MFSALAWIGSAIGFIIQKFFPYLIKRFGLTSVKLAIQKTASSIVILVTIAFYGAVVVFISETYSQFKIFIEILNNPSSSQIISSNEQSTQILGCVMNLITVSGIASGFNSAFSFGMTILIFFFFNGAYKITQSSASIISKEISNNLKLI